jgi:hypothetical protein
MPTKVKPERKTKSKISTAHLQHRLIDNLLEKIASETDVEEKIRWSWGLMKECEFLSFSEAAQKHITKCKTCRELLDSRKLLAKLVIQRGRAQG